MNRILLGISVVLLLTSASSAQMGKGGVSKFGWYSDYNAARAEAKKSGKPIFLVFRCEP
ncbi:MAG: thioredoxin family protein [Planctomycetes bacterium]|nr:thioredoxin family protein [Planctomycetota bacterium]